MEKTTIPKRKTILFERIFNVNIKDFQTTEDINKFIKKVKGKDLDVVEIKTSLVTSRGSIIPVIPTKHQDIDKLVDEFIAKM
ncbi:MAG: hypothetical protein CVT88_08140 [Candidatus Altiarchaeales archaeon HGW-Altiarchaeales-1]|nr:MAG: hypothetical protein CVT89_04860 [Candidatus Altiarchaeales archaeon HGW-Altiarchaeales-2]PKP57952.1 MAG: hypothetical protein CVT88_08140 [Candidatus Altiarchaeales archaeon HGW-Altiarchaeales-1]